MKYWILLFLSNLTSQILKAPQVKYLPPPAVREYHLDDTQERSTEREWMSSNATGLQIEEEGNLWSYFLATTDGISLRRNGKDQEVRAE